ncbi:sensor histidine kinase [Sedimentibacter sp. MB31-C6]|uniref:sensor histidine kinase n=1 Tax=Sedimentibacter sp. MB31-C6 TaxID=3109366 RepID=UPI002DDD222B|nr:ATP-binding protein [Sedimentibacter sp. MB36-C1]WSI03356.1 ATP-binding protein [Sedimentibacter sp. MB36-C1]
MKRRLLIIIIFISVFTATVTSLLSTLVYYGFYTDNAKEQIKTITNLVSENSEDWKNNNSILKSVNNILKTVNYSIRFTIIDNSGKVTFDNQAKLETLDNHRNRPEVVEAFNKGYGEYTRHSDTKKTDTYYYAIKLDNNTILRLSREISNIRDVFKNILPMIIILFIIIIIIDFFAATFLTKKIMKPINYMSNSLDDILEKEDNFEINIYEELEPFALKIKEQKSKINEYIEFIKRERDTIGIITENMKEGFILINKDKKILSINSSGKRMMQNDKFSLKEHKNILELTRDTDILRNIDKAIKENKHINYDLDKDKLHYRYYLSPVREKGNVAVEGLLILIEDITLEKNAEIMRREFTANVSHELKTPLTSMIGFAEMIKEGLITDMESIKKYCSMINSEGLRLITLIEDIMRLSKIEEGIEAGEKNIVNLREIGEEVCLLLQNKADARNVKINFHAEDININANKNYINEMLYNLIDNGIKYNKYGGNIKVNIYIKDKFIYIVVKDTGVGIPIECHNRVFERFFRVDKSRSKETGGTGLGLSIVKHIVDIYGGLIALKSNENEGTEITVKFPHNKLL